MLLRPGVRPILAVFRLDRFSTKPTQLPVEPSHPHQKHTSLTMSLSAPAVRLDSTGLSDALLVEMGRIALPSKQPSISLQRIL